jgi:hypothetical protein
MQYCLSNNSNMLGNKEVDLIKNNLFVGLNVLKKSKKLNETNNYITIDCYTNVFSMSSKKSIVYWE